LEAGVQAIDKRADGAELVASSQAIWLSVDAETLSVDAETLDQVPLERLEAEIAGFASRLASATAQWLVWIAAYDRRGGWASWGVKSCAHWLNWQCGLSPRAAREHVQVAHTIAGFDELRAVFIAGELSYSKVRALCRVVELGNEFELVRLAKQTTASQLDRIVGEMRCAQGAPTDPADILAAHRVECRNNGDGTSTMMITAATDEIAFATKAVGSRTDDIIARRQHEGESNAEVIGRLGGVGRIHADTALSMMVGNVDAKTGTEATVLVVADIDALTGQDTSAESTVDNQRVDPETVRRLCCDGSIQTALTEGNGAEVAVGSTQRIVPRRIRRLLERRDHGMCQFPGCEAERRLHAHHVRHWANGGLTDLTNLVLLCHFHHHAVHEGGWNIHSAAMQSGNTESVPAGWVFTDRAGVAYHVPTLRLPTSDPLPLNPALRKLTSGHWSSADIRSGAAAPLAGLGERADINYIADVMAGSVDGG